MLNQETRDILKQVTKIGNSAVLRYPISTITNADKSIIAFIDTSTTDEEFEDIGLFYFNEFLSLVDFYENPTVSYSNGTITIDADDGVQHYQTTEISRLKSVDAPPQLLEKMESIEAVAKMSISAEDIERAKKIGSLAKSDSFVIQGDGEEINLIVCKIDDNGNISNDSGMIVEGESSEAIKIELKLSNIDKLPSHDYTVSVILNPKSKNYVTIWEANDAPIKIVISVTQAL